MSTVTCLGPQQWFDIIGR